MAEKSPRFQRDEIVTRSKERQLRQPEQKLKSVSSPELRTKKVAFQQEGLSSRIKTSVENVVKKLSPVKTEPRSPSHPLGQHPTQPSVSNQHQPPAPNQQQHPAPNPPVIFDQEQLDMASFGSPPIFRGLHSEDVQAWFSHQDLFLQTQRNLTERAKIAHTALLFRDGALHFFNSLDVRDAPENAADRIQGVIYTYEQLKQIMLQKYRKDPGQNWREVADLYTYKQRPGQTTESFIAELQNKGVAAGATPDQIKLAALSGLRDELKQIILHHEIADIADICRWCTLGERAVASSDMAATVKKLEDVVERMQSCPLTNTAPRQDNRRPRDRGAPSGSGRNGNWMRAGASNRNGPPRGQQPVNTRRQRVDQ